MNRSEAALLLGHCAAFDNRTVGRVDAEAWAAALHDIPYDPDATAAVARFYGESPKDPGQRLWIQPHDVRRIRRSIRSERLEDFVYQPVPDETPREYLARLRGQQNAVASGQAPASRTRIALEGGPSTRDVFELVQGVGRQVPGSDEEAVIATVRRAGPLGIVCPKCEAAIGRPCHGAGGSEKQPLGKPRRTPHSDRTAAASGQHVPTAEERRQAEERQREASRRALERLQTEPEIHDIEIVDPEGDAA
ncbi:hypothetical protein ACFXJO_05765 [Streptomyces lavendulae]|uniref:zinc finger domain-containing protein n=1 Tax=Streptomyces lavendulae TaxID=1914 RepID=UPI003697E533